MKATVCLKDFVNNCIWTVLFASNLPQAPLNTCFFLSILVALMLLAQFQPKIRATNLTC